MNKEGAASEGLVESLHADIKAMTVDFRLKPGERIPSVRALSRQMRVSVNTVMEAYAQLENGGMIENETEQDRVT